MILPRGVWQSDHDDKGDLDVDVAEESVVGDDDGEGGASWA